MRSENRATHHMRPAASPSDAGLHQPAETAAHSQRLLLALGQAAQAVQRARTPQQIYQTIADEIAKLGHHAMVFTLTEDRKELALSYLSMDSSLLRAAERLAGISARDYRRDIAPGGIYDEVLSQAQTVFVEDMGQRMAEALPRLARPLVGQIARMLGLEQSIYAPLIAGDETYGLLIVTGTGLTEADTPAITAFANQAAIALENARLYNETRQRAEALQESEERFRSLLRSIDDVVWAASGDGSQFLYINDAAERVYGWPASRFLEDPELWLRAVHPDDRERVARESQDLYESGLTESEYRIMRPDGEVRWLYDRKHVTFDEEGSPIRLGGIASDITERKRAEEDLRALAETLEERVAERTQQLTASRAAALNMMADAEEARRTAERANEDLRGEIAERRRAEERLTETLADLERSNEELAQFAYIASHDLQEPLRMVASYTQLLGRRYKGRLDDDADDFINYAVEGADRMQGLINDLLAYSRVNTRGRPFELTDCNVLVDQVRTNLNTAIGETGALLTADPLPTVMADETQLVQVFDNLVGNAIKFRSDQPPRVHISATRRDGEWILSVRDNGMGIDRQYHDRVFVIFKRLHTRHQIPGTGIGLAISKRIVERHGGHIWLDSEVGTGSTFYFTLGVVGDQ